jgi:hypothetical protein
MMKLPRSRPPLVLVGTPSKHGPAARGLAAKRSCASMGEPSAPLPPLSHSQECSAADAVCNASSLPNESLQSLAAPESAPSFDGVDKDAVSQAIAAALSAVARQQQQQHEQQMHDASKPKVSRPKKPKPAASSCPEGSDGQLASAIDPPQSSTEPNPRPKKKKPAEASGEAPIVLLDDNGEHATPASVTTSHVYPGVPILGADGLPIVVPSAPPKPPRPPRPPCVYAFDAAGAAYLVPAGRIVTADDGSQTVLAADGVSLGPPAPPPPKPPRPRPSPSIQVTSQRSPLHPHTVDHISRAFSDASRPRCRRQPCTRQQRPTGSCSIACAPAEAHSPPT